MKKIGIYIIIFIVIIALIILGIFIFRNKMTDTNNSPNISIQKLSTNVEKEKPKKEVELSSFSTEILDDSEGRLTNIGITCSLINNTIIHPGEIFSFNEVVGQPSSARGYQEASIIINGEHETGIGGGNCQVSSTLYNAILAVPALEIVERNEHGLPVAYVPKGQDAAVSYGSLDLKFKNNLNSDIKIEMATDNTYITARLIQL